MDKSGYIGTCERCGKDGKELYFQSLSHSRGKGKCHGLFSINVCKECANKIIKFSRKEG